MELGSLITGQMSLPLFVGHYVFPQEGLSPALQEAKPVVQMESSLFEIKLQQASHHWWGSEAGNWRRTMGSSPT